MSRGSNNGSSCGISKPRGKRFRQATFEKLSARTVNGTSWRKSVKRDPNKRTMRDDEHVNNANAIDRRLDVQHLRRPNTSEGRDALLCRLNLKLSRLGQDRRLGESIQLFKRIIELGLSPNVISYTALLNSYVRSNEITKALGIFNSMIGVSNTKEWFTPKKQISANIISYTVIIKGLCNDGQLVQAWDILWTLLRPLCLIERDKQEKKEALQQRNHAVVVLPNIRCINTYLRGCIRVGDVLSAWVLFKICQFIVSGSSPWSSSICLLDMTSAAMIIKLLCHAQRLQQAVEVMKYFKGLNECQPDQQQSINKNSLKGEQQAKRTIMKETRALNTRKPAVKTSLSCEAIACEVKKDLKNLSENDESGQGANSSCFPVSIFIDLGTAFALRGKKQKATKYLLKAQSLLLKPHTQKHGSQKFLEHRASEQQREIDTITTFLTSHPSRHEPLSNQCKKLFFFPMKNSRVPLATLKPAIEVLPSKQNHFESDELLDSYARCLECDDTCSSMTAGLINLGFSRFNLAADYGALPLNLMPESVLDFHSIFGNSLPLKLEICSGSGDWIISRCQSSLSSNWIAMELRHDRVFQVNKNGFHIVAILTVQTVIQMVLMMKVMIVVQS